VRRKLLLADDSVTIQKVIELTFADEDIEVIAVSNGSQAISLAPVERPDIVLADVGMPERDGYEVAAFIKRTPGLSHIPVLLLTGAFEPIDEGRAQAAGCDGVLVKPFEPQMVINRVKDLIAGKRPVPGAGMQAAHPAPDRPAPARPAPVPADQFFDRLDAALSSREGDAPGASGRPTAADLGKELAGWRPDAPAKPEVPSVPASASALRASASAPGATADKTADKPSSSAPAPAASASAPTASVSAPSPSAPPTLAEAFAALLAAEQGKVPPPPPVNEEALREDVIEQVTRRVIERMGDGAVREVVVEVAERLVREEISRIRTNSR
jgi:CheY-like chemotaxis protein